MNRDKAQEVVFAAIDEMNRDRGKNPKRYWSAEEGWHVKDSDPIIEKDEEFRLLGFAIDSMGALDLVLHLEEQMEKRKIRVKITDSRAFSKSKTPFRTVGSVIDMVERLA